MYLDVNQIETAVVKVVERSYSNKKVQSSLPHLHGMILNPKVTTKKSAAHRCTV